MAMAILAVLTIGVFAAGCGSDPTGSAELRKQAGDAIDRARDQANDLGSGETARQIQEAIDSGTARQLQEAIENGATGSEAQQAMKDLKKQLDELNKQSGN